MYSSSCCHSVSFGFHSHFVALQVDFVSVPFRLIWVGFIYLLSIPLTFCSVSFREQVDIAQEFREHVFYFPYNMDFRGRTYPIPPNLNILGSDFSRGVLMFDESRPLGERGLFWLKVPY